MKSKQPHRALCRPQLSQLATLKIVRLLSIIAVVTLSSLLSQQVSANAYDYQPEGDATSATATAQATSRGGSSGRDDLHRAHPASSTLSSESLPANHRMDTAASEEQSTSANSTSSLSSSSSRHGRQYDGPMSVSGTGNYAAVSGDSSGAYVGSSMPLTGYSAAASSGMVGSGYGPGESLGVSSGYQNSAGYHDQMPIARGYPAMHSSAGAYPQHMPPPAGPYGPGPGMGALASMFPGSGPGSLFNSGSSFPLMTKGFDIAEIVCTAVAVAIGAVIVGAPFILLYLFVMNQMQGNGPTAMGPGGGSISLTGPTTSTNVGGRKKRHTSFPEALFRQLSPLVNNEQVANTFKALMNSIAKYQP